MTSQVIVNIDTKLKNKAMKMAKKEGLTMKALMSFLLKGYTEHNITLGAQISRDYDSELEVIPWTKEELELLENDLELKQMGKRFNKLIIEKGI